jgi:acetate kinase
MSAPATDILALNSGSSSLKFGLYRVTPERVETLLSGEAETIGDQAGRLRAQDGQGREVACGEAPIPNHEDAIVRVASLLAKSNCPRPAAIGHRIVHGGPSLRRHCMIDPAILGLIESAAAFAPLHTPAALAVIRFAQAHFPNLPQAACFDTAFHADMPDVAWVLPIGGDLRAQGVQRYGFHGLSCESIVGQIEGDLPDRLIIAHLGNGASITAVKGGRSVDTSMGLTPTGGVIMGTRSGDLDPGLLIYLLREKGFDAAGLEDLVDRRAGLFGVSGVAGDMRALHAAAASKPDARLAIDMFCASVAKQLAAMITVLDGVDLIVFTGGIGENDDLVRAAICARLSWLGISLDAPRNRSTTNPISAAPSRCSIRVLPSREDEQIARHTQALLAGTVLSAG